jgi:hypothetical protein
MDKEHFFTWEYIPLLRKLQPSQKPLWGVLSAQGMVEHMTDSIGQAWGRIKEPLQTQPHLLEKMKSFAMSDKPFKPLTPNSLMSATPAPLRHADMNEAIAELENEIAALIAFHKKNPVAVIVNPFFGDLNYAEWLHLLHKHATHHLRQFAVIE